MLDLGVRRVFQNVVEKCDSGQMKKMSALLRIVDRAWEDLGSVKFAKSGSTGDRCWTSSLKMKAATG
jgi:hypothetical protein